jgi:TRAP-type C4-dicarboxylate transport system permease small subunit
MPLNTSTPSRSVPSSLPCRVSTIVMATVDHLPGRTLQPVAVALLVVFVLVVAAAVVGGVVLSRRMTDEAARADAAAAELASARDELEAARGERDDAADRADAGDALVRSMWSLELLRVAREWAATSGGADDVAPVAADTGAELATALRLELDRRREETGVPGELGRVSLAAVPVASALAALRLVEEVVAAVSRSSEGFTVALRSDDDALAATIALDAVDAPDVPAVLRDVATAAGASIAVDGTAVTVTVPC